jgi:Transcriptional antiterminator
MLDNGDWMTAGLLANELDVSERSIKSYIAEINYHEKGLITSSRKGYSLDADRARNLLDTTRVKLPQTSKERVNYIITRLIMGDASGDKKTDLYELADEIFVSLETIKKDITKVKKRIMDYELVLSSSSSFISLEGEELDKRKLLSTILYEEFSNNVMSLEILEREFPDYDLELLQNIIKNECKKCHYFINEYALLNLVLDIAIGIDRIKKERTFGRSRKEGNRFGIREQELAQNIAAEIEHNFRICYSSLELEELTIILLSHLMKVDYTTLNTDNIEHVVGKNCVDIVDEIMDLLKKTYYIDTNNKDFIIKFTLHIKNLLVRLENGYTTKNPLLDHIKNTCPLIFECAVEIADKLTQITKYDIKEDEIAYIALHIGGNLETQKSKRKIISCIILFPQYYDFSNQLIEKLKEHYGERLDIKTVITTLEEIKGVEKADLIISTIPVYETIYREWVMITPFLNSRDFQVIEDKILKINLRKNKARLKKHLMEISNPKLFYKNLELKNRQEAIRYMTDIMIQEGYVSESYYQEVFDRENQASTAFGHIAVPHSMKMNAYKTGMFILINEKKPLKWGKHYVNIVLLFAINEDQREIFHDVYDNLIVLLLEKPNAAKITGCNTYIEFIEAVIECFN